MPGVVLRHVRRQVTQLSATSLFWQCV